MIPALLAYNWSTASRRNLTLRPFCCAWRQRRQAHGTPAPLHPKGSSRRGRRWRSCCKRDEHRACNHRLGSRPVHRRARPLTTAQAPAPPARTPASIMQPSVNAERRKVKGRSRTHAQTKMARTQRAVDGWVGKGRARVRARVGARVGGWGTAVHVLLRRTIEVPSCRRVALLYKIRGHESKSQNHEAKSAPYHPLPPSPRRKRSRQIEETNSI